MYRLSQRMQLIFDHLIPGEPVWDFCCDHGYMGLSAYESGLFPKVYFVDQVTHIVEKLRARFMAEYFKENVATEAHFIASSGEEISEILTGNVVIAGVGAFTTSRILRSLADKKVLQARRLILCPQTNEERLLQSLAEIPGFSYQKSHLDCQIVERGRIRKLLIFDKI